MNTLLNYLADKDNVFFEFCALFKKNGEIFFDFIHKPQQKTLQISL